MSKKGDRLWIALKLANFNLKKDGWRLLMTTKQEKWLKIVMEHLIRIRPERQYRTENFAVKVLRKDRDDNVLDWEKTEGFSFWEIMEESEDE